MNKYHILKCYVPFCVKCYIDGIVSRDYMSRLFGLVPQQKVVPSKRFCGFDIKPLILEQCLHLRKN